MSSLYCFLNGKILPLQKARISPLDLGILRGYGVFDFLRTYQGKPFLLKEHLRRFRNSAENLNLKIPYSDEEIERIIRELVKRNKILDAGIRLVLTGGPSSDAETVKKPTFFILTGKIKEIPQRYYLKGAKIVTVDGKRENPYIKSINYINYTKLANSIFPRQKDVVEIVYAPNGKVLEGGTSNIFIFKKGVLQTPKEGVLMGITRNFVIQLAKKNFSVQERPIFLDDLYNAEEAFLTSTNKEIMPVVQADNFVIGEGKVGENTKILMEMFKKEVKKIN